MAWDATFGCLTQNAPITADSEIRRAVSQTPAVQSLLERLENGGELSLRGISEASQSFWIALLHQVFPRETIIAVTHGVRAQEVLHQDVETWLSGNFGGRREPVRPSGSCSLYFPPWETLPHEAKLPHADTISERLETLVALSRCANSREQAGHLVITSATALMQRTFAAGEIENRTRVLKRGDRIEPLDLVEWLEEQGYEPEAQVTQKGELALRGGILDFYPLTSPWPVRLEFFGEEIESLRFFDPFSQISRDAMESVALPPGGEIGMLKRLSGRLGILLDYAPRESIVVLCEPDQLLESVEEYARQVPDNDPFFADWDELLEAAAARKLRIVRFSEEAGEMAAGDPSEAGEIFLGCSSLEAFRPLAERMPEPRIADAQRREFFHQLHRWTRQDFSVHVFCNNQGERERFTEIWQEYGLGELASTSIAARPRGRKMSGEARGVVTHLGSLSRGFTYEPAKLVVVTDAEIFGRYKVQRPRRLKSPHAAATRSALDIDFADLEEGDYVVHLQHGIGRYLGLNVLPPVRSKGQAQPADSGQECLVIEYAPSDAELASPKLYVPVTEAHLVSKYVGAGKARPSLNTLGGTRWAKAKAHAEEAVRDLAGQLLSLQATRESQAGHAFAADTAWQREFESAFLYEETPDQLRAITEAKRDMETPRPMDRLICGDVGYGKTEVAIRAAFKSVLGGKQVAILVPTTILAQQHYNTFRERMADYPVRIEQLSRFCTRGQQTLIIRQLREGAVDIVIGTHRLLQDDIAFKELGLVVIDEEQRFGVLHKEKLKLLRTLVDVLTLSATPIPRTLYLALTGARDMSTIETPPQDRLPVETVVTQYDERVVRDAIRRELNRQGQVYYLHNRVHDIDSVALRLRALLPEARVVVGHGQMHSDDLEDVMAKFINGEADVLVSTTIIESGIDIPNANTIIIDRADRFGLSDLYQLRGRVGRYKHQAFAYLLLPRHAMLLTDARKRISAIRQYSSLGSGFKIAMRDLEIRGAGNLLGPQQSGHITAVGFELYCQLLKQSVSALKGEKVKPRVEVAVRIDFLALHPGEETVPSGSAPDDGGGDFPEKKREKKSGRRRKVDAPGPITVPRETAAYTSSEREEIGDGNWNLKDGQPAVEKAPAYIPFAYIAESRQRIGIYRKLAQTTDKAGLEQLRAELRDRFGKIPPAVERLLQVAELKYLAAERGVVSIETKQDKIMLVRSNDFITPGGKFPRFTKKDAQGRLNEIKKLLLAV